MAGGIGAYSNQDLFAQDARRRAYLYANQSQAAQAQAALQNAAMQQQYMDEMSVMAAQQPSRVSQPEGCKDGKDDGKIGGWQAIKHFGKGIGKFFTGLVGFDKDGNWSAGRLLKNVAIGAGIAAVCVLTAGTAVPAVIAGLGVASAVGGLAKSGYQFFTAKTDAQARAAAEGMGSNTVALAASVVGAKAAMKQVPGVDPTKYTGVKGSFKAAWDSTTIGFKQGWNAVKTGYQAYKAGGWQALKTTATDSAQGFWATVKGNWNNATKQLTAQETQDSRVKDLDNQINEYKTKAAEATDKGVKNALNKKVKRLEEQKANIQEAFDDINSQTSLEAAQNKINSLEQKIAFKKRQVATSTDKRFQFKANYEISKLEQQANIYKSVIEQKTTLARNLRSQIDDIDNLAPEAKTAEVMAKRAELVKQQTELKFEIPARSQKEAFVKNSVELTKDLTKKQELFDKAQKELASAEKAYKGFKAGDTSAERLEAFRALTDAKDAARIAAENLQNAKFKARTNNANISAASGYDYVGTYGSKLGQFGKTFNNLYGSKDIPLVGGKKVPFTKYTLPTSIPRSQMLVASSEYVNPTVGGPSLDEMLLAEMGYSPEQIKAMQQEIEQMNQLAAMQQSVPQGYMEHPAAQAPAAGHAPTMADFQQLDAMLRMYGVA